MITPQEALQRTIEHREIFHDEMLHLMRQIMGGEITPLMVAAILTGLRVKKETIGEISAAAKVMRELCTRVETPHNPHFVDIVGTHDTPHDNLPRIRQFLDQVGHPPGSVLRPQIHRGRPTVASPAPPRRSPMNRRVACNTDRQHRLCQDRACRRT